MVPFIITLDYNGKSVTRCVTVDRAHARFDRKNTAHYLTRAAEDVCCEYVPKLVLGKFEDMLEDKVTLIEVLRELAIQNATDPVFHPEDVVYLAGPMTGKPLYNYPAFFGWAGLLEKEYGCTVLNPAREPNGLTREEYLNRALENVRKATHLFLLNGWSASQGVKGELALARQLGKRIVCEPRVADQLAGKIVVE